ncbi:MAG: phosphatase PAP2 family protein [Deltaproteobacteria bacterium]|nr:phosphatase PAP2 family protein [Deltaproteobacteria bacterium]
MIYESKDGKEEKVFDALGWFSAMTSHVSNKGGKWSAIMATIAMPPVVAIGPRYTLVHLYSVPLRGSFLTDVLREGLNGLEYNKRGVMPSGHTQIALMVLYLAYRYQKVLFYSFLFLIVALIVSTVSFCGSRPTHSWYWLSWLRFALLWERATLLSLRRTVRLKISSSP